MKTGLSICAVLCMSALAFGQTLVTSDAEPGNRLGSSRAVAPPGAAEEDCAGVEKVLDPVSGVACAGGAPRTATENGAARAWENFPGGTITNVTWAVEVCSDETGGGQPCEMSVILWDAPNFPSISGATELWTSDPQMIDGNGGDDLTIRELAVPNVDVPAGTNLVLEAWHESFQPTWAYFPGGNLDGAELTDTLIRAAPCGIPGWVSYESIGFFGNLVLCIDVGGGGENCDGKKKAKLSAACKKGGKTVKAKLKKAAKNTDVTFGIDGGDEIKKKTNSKGVAKAKFKKQEKGGHTVTVCDLEAKCG